MHSPFEKIDINRKLTVDSSSCKATPNQLRWQPFPIGVHRCTMCFSCWTATTGHIGAMTSYSWHQMRMYLALRLHSSIVCCFDHGNCSGNFRHEHIVYGVSSAQHQTAGCSRLRLLGHQASVAIEFSNTKHRVAVEFSHTKYSVAVEFSNTKHSAEPVNFIEGLVTVCCAGSCATKDGCAMHIYTCTQDMKDCCLCNADGDFLIVPQQGAASPPFPAIGVP